MGDTIKELRDYLDARIEDGSVTPKAAVHLRDRIEWAAAERERLRAALGEALVPLAVLVADEGQNGPIREISPTLRESIRKGHDAALGALRNDTRPAADRSEP